MDERAAEELFRHKVLALLRRRGLLSEERIELLLSRRLSGFSVHNRVWAHPAQGREFEALVRYMSRCPVSLKRLRSAPGSKEVVYTRKGRHRGKAEMRVVSFITDPRVVKRIVDHLRKRELWRTRVAAAEALGNMGEAARSAIPALELVRLEKDDSVATPARAALEKIRKASESKPSTKGCRR